MKPMVFDDIREADDSRYTLVVASAKRARQLLAGSASSVASNASKPVTIALEEIRTGKVRWIRTKEGIK